MSLRPIVEVYKNCGKGVDHGSTTIRQPEATESQSIIFFSAHSRKARW